MYQFAQMSIKCDLDNQQAAREVLWVCSRRKRDDQLFGQPKKEIK